MKTGREDGTKDPRAGRFLRGIVVTGGIARAPRQPRISAFIWGGKVRPTPTLPYGRWKGAA